MSLHPVAATAHWARDATPCTRRLAVGKQDRNACRFKICHVVGIGVDEVQLHAWAIYRLSVRKVLKAKAESEGGTLVAGDKFRVTVTLRSEEELRVMRSACEAAAKSLISSRKGVVFLIHGPEGEPLAAKVGPGWLKKTARPAAPPLPSGPPPPAPPCGPIARHLRAAFAAMSTTPHVAPQVRASLIQPFLQAYNEQGHVRQWVREDDLLGVTVRAYDAPAGQGTYFDAWEHRPFEQRCVDLLAGRREPLPHPSPALPPRPLWASSHPPPPRRSQELHCPRPPHPRRQLGGALLAAVQLARGVDARRRLLAAPKGG